MAHLPFRSPRILAAVIALTSLLLSSAAVTGVSFAAGGSTVRPVSSATTPAWVNGQTVTIQYAQNFSCDRSVASGASSGCEIGVPANRAPNGQQLSKVSTLYVLVPFFAPTENLNLHCPDVGSCVNHPMTIDLSAVGLSPNAALPAHSHILDGPAGGLWKIEVVGILNQTSWNQLAAGKSLATLRAVQASGGATGDVGTNLFLFFNVVGHS